VRAGWPGPGHKERNDVRVGSSEAAELTGDRTQLGRPVLVRGVDGQLRENRFGNSIEQLRLGCRMTIERHRVATKGASEPAHGKSIDPVLVDDLQRRVQHHFAAQPRGSALVRIDGDGRGDSQ